MTRFLRAELLLPLVIVSAAAMVAISEFMTTFEFDSGGEPQALSLASDRHSYALLILAVLTVAGMTYAIVTGLRSAAVATAVLGCAGLLLFLVLDLPDAGKAGPLGDDPTLYFADAKADPDTGFWLEAVGTVILGLACVAFATLSSKQLQAPMELFRGRKGKAEATTEVFNGDDGVADGTEEPRELAESPKPRRERRAKSERSKPERAERKSPEPERAERKSRRPARERPARERSTALPRTASEERAAARERLAQARSKAPGDSRKDEPAAESEDKPSRLGFLRRLSGSDS